MLSLLGYAGLFTGTVVERKVFENSYQYSESRKSENAIYRAQLAEIERKLMSSTLDESTRTNFEAQASAIRIRLAAAQE